MLIMYLYFTICILPINRKFKQHTIITNYQNLEPAYFCDTYWILSLREY